MRAGRRIIASRVDLPCLCDICTWQKALAKEKERKMHIREKRKSGIYSSGIEKSLENDERYDAGGME